MAKEKAPAMPFYVRDYWGDVNVQAMTWEQRGIYDHLLFLCWAEGSIPAAAEELISILKIPRKRFHQIWPRIARCFNDSGDGRLRHAKVDAIRAAKDVYRTAQAEYGRAGAKKRWSAHAAVNTAVDEGHGSRESVPVSMIDAFERAWKLHPNGIEHDLALQVFISLWFDGKITEDEAGEIEAGMRRWRDSEDWQPEHRRFLPGSSRAKQVYNSPAAWFQLCAWRDHPTPSEAARAAASEQILIAPRDEMRSAAKE